MGPWEYLAWGIFGGVLVAGLDFVGVVGRVGDWPWKDTKRMRPGPYWAAALVRLLLSGGLALAAGQSGLIISAVAAVGVGVATPLIVEKLGKTGSAFLSNGG